MSSLDHSAQEKHQSTLNRQHEVTRQLYDRWCSHENYQIRMAAWYPLADIVATNQQFRYSDLPYEVRAPMGQLNHFFADFYVLWHHGMLEPNFARDYFSTALPAWARLYAAAVTEFNGYDTRHPLTDTSAWLDIYLIPFLQLILSWDDTLQAHARKTGKPLSELLSTYNGIRNTVKTVYPTPQPAKP
jgi:hypothetical protein